MDEATARAFGRIESTLDRIADQQVEVLTTSARHDERLRMVEGRVDDIEAKAGADDRHAVSFRSALTVAACTVFASAAVSVLANHFFPR